MVANVLNVLMVLSKYFSWKTQILFFQYINILAFEFVVSLWHWIFEIECNFRSLNSCHFNKLAYSLFFQNTEPFVPDARHLRKSSRLNLRFQKWRAIVLLINFRYLILRLVVKHVPRIWIVLFLGAGGLRSLSNLVVWIKSSWLIVFFVLISIWSLLSKTFINSTPHGTLWSEST